ncbi:hypothetical protein AA12717_1399 [Gluconacetobacter sacchari DSM 12717]|uniref:Uncharacterized protein n=2 Tax=Gluconacetobacter sacchari TaxID=92759 RepID=A0A7W4NR36_9PROT|nr:hypothetical protein [Gluconacetobacter sacchari]MBB2159720.1 hypothetical protein [Gluconacetobacter sacchari]GBQ23123.1 hypothetical protein AA12717_1399 [Gluconacetobacter sacchari DSM 12717]
MANRANGALSFAHLLGSTTLSRGRRAEEDDNRVDTDEDDGRDGADAEDDDSHPAGRRARGADDDSGDDDDDRPAGRRARRADNDDDGEAGDGEPAGRRASRRRADDGDDDDASADDETDEDDPQASAARSRERARCAAIFRSKAAARRPDLAAHLAFNTRLPRNQAVDLLRASAAGGRSRSGDTGLSARMRAFGDARVGMDRAAPDESVGASRSWEASAARAGIKLKS